MRKLILSALAIAAIAGCQKTESSDSSDVLNGVEFSASTLSTRLSSDGTEWAGDEEVGIYMEGADVATNIKYLATGSGDEITLTADDDVIYYPRSGSVAFYAYTPFSDDVSTDGKYQSDLSSQKDDLESVYFMCGSAPDKSDGDVVSFVFEHQLAKMTIKVTKNDNITSLAGLKVSIDGVYPQAKYSYKGGTPDFSGYTTGTIEFTVTEYSDYIEAVAVLHPDDVENARLYFEEEDETIHSTLISYDFSANNIYPYEVVLGRGYISVSASETISGWSGSGESTDMGTLDKYTDD